MFKNLVLGSGAVSGLAYLGALKELIKQKYLNLEDIENYCGCSVGSLIALFLIIGYTIDDLILLTRKLDFKDFLDIKAEDALSFFHNYGFDNGKRIQLIIELFLTKRNFNKDVTLLELYNITNKNLIITTVCLNTKTAVYFNYKKTPDCKVVDCIRASMAIPFLYQPVKIQNEYYIDGGVVKSFPIEYFRKEKELTFGLKSKHTNRYLDNHDTEDFTNSIDNFKNYVLHIFYCPAVNSYRIPSKMTYLEVDIIEDGLNVDNNVENRMKYINCGILDAKEFLSNINAPKN